MQSLLSRLKFTISNEAYCERDSASKPACREFSTGWNSCRCGSLPDCLHIAHGKQYDLSGWYLELRFRLQLLDPSVSSLSFNPRFLFLALEFWCFEVWFVATRGGSEGVPDTKGNAVVLLHSRKILFMYGGIYRSLIGSAPVEWMWWLSLWCVCACVKI